jgi:hypothetical protein
MNKRLKSTLIIINILMLVIAIFWYLENEEKEPLIVCLGQFVILIGLFFEKQAAKIFTKNIHNSEVKIKKQNGDSIHTEGIKNSKIVIR